MTQTELDTAREMQGYYDDRIAEAPASPHRVHWDWWRAYYAAKARDLAWIERPALAGSAVA